jgi:hypothetical protein
LTVPIQLERSLKTEQSRIIPEETTMQFNFKKLALLGAWIIFAEGSVDPQDVNSGKLTYSLFIRYA